jgi:RHS repeat-associated protein
VSSCDSAGGEVTYLHGDHLGSTSLTTDGDGDAVARQLYHPYGVRAISQMRGWSDGTLPTDFWFTGQRADGTTQLIHMGARWHNARLGRWLSADTMVPDHENPQALNRFSYVLGNPMVYVDPTGHGPFPPPTTTPGPPGQDTGEQIGRAHV